VGEQFIASASGRRERQLRHSMPVLREAVPVAGPPTVEAQVLQLAQWTTGDASALVSTSHVAALKITYVCMRAWFPGIARVVTTV